MCGIVGLIGSVESDAQSILERMNSSLLHRGPDDGGMWSDPSLAVHLAHRRLSIIDLSPEGRQPMRSHGGRYVISYNGEVYNFAEIRKELERFGSSFRGHSDTEVVLAAIERWGVEAAVRRFIGMFAFAVFDRMERRLHLVRDRMGIKPLYFGWAGRSFVFASEPQAFLHHPEFQKQIDKNSMALFLRYNHVPAPYTIFSRVFKLPPGNILSITTDELRTIYADESSQKLERKVRPFIREYWSVRSAMVNGYAAPFRGSEGEATNELERLLADSIKIRMISDVPLGAFLSGGVDSSAVVALMQAQSARPVKTFSIGFWEEAYNEAKYAKEVAKHLGTDHTELYVTPKDALDVIPKLPHMYAEPFADSSQIPTYLVSELARQHVTVSLSGDGGDELFGGYYRYLWAQNIWNSIKWMPSPLRKVLSSAMLTVPTERWDVLLPMFLRFFPQRLRFSAPGDKLHKLAGVMGAESQHALYIRLLSLWQQPTRLVPGAKEPLVNPTNLALSKDVRSFLNRMMLVDMTAYLPDDILVKLDRASMSVSLEGRVPLLDHRVVEFAWSLPDAYKVAHGQSKLLLRNVLYRHVPRELIERPKMGFGVPIDQWVRGPLREWAESLLSEEALSAHGLLDVKFLRARWAEHLSGKRNWQYQLWCVLMFQAWYEAHIGSSSSLEAKALAVG